MTSQMTENNKKLTIYAQLLFPFGTFRRRSDGISSHSLQIFTLRYKIFNINIESSLTSQQTELF